MASATPVRPRARPRPHPVVTPVTARTRAVPPRRAVPAPIEAGMPSPAAMLAMLPGLWDQHHAHDLAALRAVRLKDEAAHKLDAVAKDRIWERIKATQELILASQPTSLADAAAILLMAHSEIETWNDDHGGDQAHYAIVALLNHALVAIGFVARASGVDPAGAKNYLTEAQAMIVRGEVVA